MEDLPDVGHDRGDAVAPLVVVGQPSGLLQGLGRGDDDHLRRLGTVEVLVGHPADGPDGREAAPREGDVLAKAGCIVPEPDIRARGSKRHLDGLQRVGHIPYAGAGGGIPDDVLTHGTRPDTRPATEPQGGCA